jgi:ribosomal protein S18 acetylase RimI-like enzyme
MPKRARDGWRLVLPSAPSTARHGACVGLKLRAPRAQDAEAIARLLLEAYRGTVDDEGEDLDASRREVLRYFGGKQGGPAMLRESVVAWRGTEPVGVCLVCEWTLKGRPVVAFIATHPDMKGAGVGRLLLAVSVRRLSRAGHGEVLAVITRGNTPSQRLFQSVGFEVFERREAATS